MNIDIIFIIFHNILFVDENIIILPLAIPCVVPSNCIPLPNNSIYNVGYIENKKKNSNNMKKKKNWEKLYAKKKNLENFQQ